MRLEPGELMPAPLGIRFHLGAFDPHFGLKISIWPIIFGCFGAPAGNHDVSASVCYDSVPVARRMDRGAQSRRKSVEVPRSSSRSLNEGFISNEAGRVKLFLHLFFTYWVFLFSS